MQDTVKSTSNSSQVMYKQPKHPKAKKIYENQKGFLYLLPALIVLIVFTVYPLINTLILSFIEGYDSLQASNPGFDLEFNIGFKNFAEVLGLRTGETNIPFESWIHDVGQILIGNNNNVELVVSYQTELFWAGLRNTVVIVALTVIPSVLISLLVAVALNSIKPLQKFFQTVFFLPYLTNTLAIAAVFQIMFQSPDPNSVAGVQGLINNVVEFFGGTPIDWLGGTNYWASIAVVVIHSIWSGLAFKVLIILGALQNVNKQCYDAAKIDGTSKGRVLRKITVPLISPMLAYLVVTGFIGAFKEYSAVLGLFNTGINNDMGTNNFMITIVGFIYQYIDGNFAGQYGMASAASFILLVIIMIFTLINMQINKKKVHY